MDRNQVIGFVLIGLLLIGMFAINSKSRQDYERQQKKIADSVAALKPKVTPAAVNSAAARDTVTATSSGFQLGKSSASSRVLENKVMKITFTDKGGQPVSVEMKKYNRQDRKPVIVQQEGSQSFDRISYLVNAGVNKTIETSDLIFTAGDEITGPDGSKMIRYTAADSSGNIITHSYTLRDNDYLVDFDIELKGKNNLLGRNTLTLNWMSECPAIEQNIAYEKTQTNICYYKKEEGFDFEYLGTGDDLKLQGPVNWVAVKQQFFVRALISKSGFSSAPVNWTVPADTVNTFIARSTTNASIELQSGDQATIPLQLYFGPSDYNILKKYGNHLEEMVPYGSGVFAFVKYINRYMLLPVFDFFQKYIANMGIVILLLTLFIRLITSPILYKSYLSGAKMKALKPEVDALRAKFTDSKTKEFDQQGFGMEQMKLWRSAGVSPLGGCLPALLQIPIFMSLYYFFQSNIDLRDKAFLWSKDLSAFDSILDLSFSIPFYGSHVSLFTLTAVITSLLISIYSMSNMQDNNNPMMKYMPYIFPVLLLGVFNSLPSALTWYYTVSNVVTLLLQFIIQTYIINHDKILAQIEENRKKPVKQSKFQERLQAMQETQRKLQDMKDKTAKGRK